MQQLTIQQSLNLFLVSSSQYQKKRKNIHFGSMHTRTYRCKDYDSFGQRWEKAKAATRPHSQLKPLPKTKQNSSINLRVTTDPYIGIPSPETYEVQDRWMEPVLCGQCLWWCQLPTQTFGHQRDKLIDSHLGHRQTFSTAILSTVPRMRSRDNSLQFFN